MKLVAAFMSRSLNPTGDFVGSLRQESRTFSIRCVACAVRSRRSEPVRYRDPCRAFT